MSEVKGLVNGELPRTNPLTSSRPPADPGGVGAAAREHRAATLDAWLGGLLDRATNADGVALVAPGGLRRLEGAPNADVDLALVHGDIDDLAAIADKNWYPICEAV